MEDNTQSDNNRRSVRLPAYDYSQAGFYFVTICTHNRRSLFGDIIDGVMRLNTLGKIVQEELLTTLELRPNVELDEFTIMPNHLHAISITQYQHPDKIGRGVLHTPDYLGHIEIFTSPSQTLGAIVRGLKSSVTARCKREIGDHILPIWQRNYYEHVIRDEEDLRLIREYIVNNPVKWAFDHENPENIETIPGNHL